MSFRVTRVEASPSARAHIWDRHRVDVWEVEEVLRSAVRFRRGRWGRYVCDGPTGDGRWLRVVFERRGRRATRRPGS